MKNKQNYRLRLLSIALALCALLPGSLTSCSEDFDPWQLVKLELSTDLEKNEVIGYKGKTFDLMIQTETDWTISTPDWMTVDKTQGTGNETVRVTVAQTDQGRERTGTINVRAASAQENSNFVGTKQEKISIKQESLSKAVNFIITKAEVKKYNTQKRYVSGTSYNWSTHDITITYRIESELSDTELAEMVGNPHFRAQCYSNAPYGYSESYWNVQTEAPFPRNERTITVKEWTNWYSIRSGEIYVRWNPYGIQNNYAESTRYRLTVN